MNHSFHSVDPPRYHSHLQQSFIARPALAPILSSLTLLEDDFVLRSPQRRLWLLVGGPDQPLIKIGGVAMPLRHFRMHREVWPAPTGLSGLYDDAEHPSRSSHPVSVTRLRATVCHQKYSDDPDTISSWVETLAADTFGVARSGQRAALIVVLDADGVSQIGLHQVTLEECESRYELTDRWGQHRVTDLVGTFSTHLHHFAAAEDFVEMVQPVDTYVRHRTITYKD